MDIRLNGKTVAHFDRLEVDEEAVYSTRETLPESGTYNLVAHVEGKEVKLPFYLFLVYLLYALFSWVEIGEFVPPIFLMPVILSHTIVFYLFL